MANLKYISIPPKTLAVSVGPADLTFKVSDIYAWISGGADVSSRVALTASDFGSRAFGAFRDPSGTQLEFFEFDPTTIANASITILHRGLKYDGTLDTEVTANKGTWVKNQTIVELGATVSQLFEGSVSNFGDETIDGIKTFTSSPVVPTATTGTQAINKNQLDAATYSGAVDASTAAKGVTRLSTSPNVTVGTFTVTIASPAVFSITAHGLTLTDSVFFTTTGALPTGLATSTTYYVISAGLTANTFEVSATPGGVAINTSGSQSGTHTVVKNTPVSVTDSDPRVPTQGENDAIAGNNTTIPVGSGNKLITQTGLQNKAETYATSTGSSNAYVLTLSPVPTAYAAGQEFEFKANFSNTGTTTINVNGLGAKTINKIDGATALVANDINTGQIVKIKYDGTNFQLLSPAAAGITYTSGLTTRVANTASGSQTIAHGLGVVPKNIRITAFYNNFVNAGSGSTVDLAQSVGTYNGTTASTAYAYSYNGGTNGDSSTSGVNGTVIILLVRVKNAGSTTQSATVTVDATNINLTWTYTTTGGGNNGVQMNILWEANS